MISFKGMGHHGLLGNQMFQYSTLYSVAKENNYDFSVPYSNTGDIQFFHFFLPNCFPELTAKNSDEAETINIFIERSFEYDESIFSIPDKTDIRGYFQSPKYFQKHRNEILKEFKFSESISTSAKNIKNKFDSAITALHIRLGDYVHQPQHHPVCSYEYYVKALDLIPDNSIIFVFSDDINLAKELFSSIKKEFIFPGTGCKYTDMCLMSLCDYHIIANSSFSWWGAWLSNSKQVIAPANWFGNAPHMPKNWSDIYCDEWIVI